MTSTLNLLAKKHQDWIRIVKSFGCNADTAEDIVQEMYIKINSVLLKGTNIMYNEIEINHFYIFRTLRSMFLDLIRKESKVTLIEFDKNCHNNKTDEMVNFQAVYNMFLHNLDEMHWYDRKVFEYIENGESIAGLSEKTKISYYSLYNTYKRVKKTLLKKI
jgi:DNA-directed RNA polymerase specialized sigma24 family protein